MTTAIENSPCLKVLTESSSLQYIPSNFCFISNSNGSHSDSIPTIDFSLLTSSDPDQRSKAIQELSEACQQWGFFMLENHGIPKTLMKSLIDVSLEFFELGDEDKKKYEPKSLSDPISSGIGTIVNSENNIVQPWRDYVKAFVHPEFHCPEKPQNFRLILSDYVKKCRLVAKILLEAISESMGLEKGYINEALKLDSSSQVFNSNYYPICPQPDEAIGMAPHTDYGLFTFLIDNGVPGLQIMNKGQWFNTNSTCNSILVNTGDHLEIFSNGRYKSVKHRAVVNNETTRISVALANGPARNVIVEPASRLVELDGHSLYRPMGYKEYTETMFGARLSGKSKLESIKIDHLNIHISLPE